MITSIKINGFKSFQNFEMTFTPLTVVAGVNASGKSNLFDALQLLSRLAGMDLKTAFSSSGQRGNPSELFTQYGENWYAPEMDFTVEMLVNRKVKDNWGAEAELNNTRLRYRLTIARKPNELGIDDLVVKHENLEKIKYENDQWVKATLPKEAKPLWENISKIFKNNRWKVYPAFKHVNTELQVPEKFDTFDDLGFGHVQLLLSELVLMDLNDPSHGVGQQLERSMFQPLTAVSGNDR